MKSQTELSLLRWVKDSGIVFTSRGPHATIENTSDSKRRLTLRLPLVVSANVLSLSLKVKGHVRSGSGFGITCRLNEQSHYPVPLNSVSDFGCTAEDRLQLTIEVGPRCVIDLNEFLVEEHAEQRDHLFDRHLVFDSTLIVAPTYPSSNHLYLSGFVHSRILEYRRQGLKPVVLCIYNSYLHPSVYDFEGVTVLRGGLSDLLQVLNKHQFQRIGVHFFDEFYALAFDRAVGNRETPLLFWCHGPETLFHDLPQVNGPYFEPYRDPSSATVERHRALAKLVTAWQQRDRVHWIFISEWMKKRSEELLGIEFRNASIIPNVIDTDLFRPVEKTAEARNRVLVLRRYDNERKYAVDLTVQAIVELSRRSCFESLSFTIAGDGPLQAVLFEPLRRFKNVAFIQRFFDHTEIAALHRSHGMALFPTRYDSQGVSACEAASSGLVVFSSDCSAVSEFISREHGTLAPENSALELANAIERYAGDQQLYAKTSAALSREIREKCATEGTIDQELALLRSRAPVEHVRLASATSDVYLTVGVPLYNMERLIERCLNSLLCQGSLRGLEVLVVDDGSKDGSLEVARRFERRYPKVVRVLSKENGGHGSAVNVILNEARGRYVRVVDADDWVDPVAFAQLLPRLENETVDVVVTDYAEDWAHLDQLVEKKLYTSLPANLEIPFDIAADPAFGFQSWGPVLATANFRLERLRQAQVSLDEGIAYVDMEYCTLPLSHIDSLRYIDLSVYRYYLGRPNQSIERRSFEKRYRDHEKVILRIAAFAQSGSLSQVRQNYVVRSILVPLIRSHRMVLGEWLERPDELSLFDAAIRQFKILANVDLAPLSKNWREHGRSKLRQTLIESVKAVLPYRFVQQLEPNLLKNGRRAAVYAFEYFAPSSAVSLIREFSAGRLYWYENSVINAARHLSSPRYVMRKILNRFGSSSS